jgi:hypothetical protein
MPALNRCPFLLEKLASLQMDPTIDHIATKVQVIKFLFLAVTSQDFVKFWGNFFAFYFVVLIEFSQEIETFEFI